MQHLSLKRYKTGNEAYRRIVQTYRQQYIRTQRLKAALNASRFAAGTPDPLPGFVQPRPSQRATAAEKRKFAQEQQSLERATLLRFAALGLTGLQPIAAQSAQDRARLLNLGNALKRGEKKLEDAKQLALRYMRMWFRKTVDAADEAVKDTRTAEEVEEALLDVLGAVDGLHVLSHDLPGTRRPPASYKPLHQLDANESIPEMDGIEPDIAALVEGAEEPGADSGPQDSEPSGPGADSGADGENKPPALYRRCDDQCVLPANWASRIIQGLRRIVGSTYRTIFVVETVVGVLDELEKCERCDSRANPGGIGVPSAGTNCRPPQQCQDWLRWFRYCVSPHYTPLRTLLRRLYTFRHHLTAICQLESTLNSGNERDILDLLGLKGAKKADAGAKPFLSTVPETEIKAHFASIFGKFEAAMSDYRNKACDVCERRCSVSELQPHPYPTGTRRSDRVQETDGQGAPLINIPTAAPLAHVQAYLAFMGLTKCRICRKCYSKLRSKPAPPPENESAAARKARLDSVRDYNVFLGQVRQHWRPRRFPDFHSSGPPLTSLESGDTAVLPNIPRLSIFNGCIFSPLPQPIKDVVAKGVYHINLIKQIFFPLSPSANTKYVNNMSLPNLSADTLIIQRTAASDRQLQHILIDKQAVSAALDFLKRNHIHYPNITNAWNAEELQRMGKEAAELAAGMEPEADSDDDGEDSAPPDSVYPRKHLRIRQVDLDAEEDTSGPLPPQPAPIPVPPSQDPARSLQHLGNSRLEPFTASAQIQKAVTLHGTDLELFSNKKVEAAPFSGFDPAMESRPYPHIYPYGRFGYDHGRPLNVNEGEFTKLQLERLDPRCAEDKEYLFAQASRKILRSISSSVFFLIRSRAWRTDDSTAELPSVGDVLGKMESGDADDLEPRINSIVRKVPGTSGYWMERRQQLEAMSDTFGPPTWFLTFSPAEYDDHQLRDFLCSLPSHISDLPSLSMTALTQLNGTAGAEWFHKRTKLMLKLLVTNPFPGLKAEHDVIGEWRKRAGMPEPDLPPLLSTTPAPEPQENDEEDTAVKVAAHSEEVEEEGFVLPGRARGLFGTVLHWFHLPPVILSLHDLITNIYRAIRLEYQGRGKGHYHILLWIADAPALKPDMTAEEKAALQAYIESLVTVSTPDPMTSPELHGLVSQYQTHRCRPSCRTRRQKVRTNADGVRQTTFVYVPCRYGYPFPPNALFSLLDPSAAVKGLLKEGTTHELYTLVRDMAEAFNNGYHPVLLLLHRANMDLKYVYDPDGKLNYYLSKYLTKKDKDGKGDEAWHALDLAVQAGKSVCSRLLSLGLAACADDMGQEAASDFLTGVPLFTTSETCHYISVSPAHKRRHMLRGGKDKLESLDKDELPVFPGFWNGVYPFRPAELEEHCAFSIWEHFDRFTERQHHERMKSYIKRTEKAILAGKDVPPMPTFYRSLDGTPDNSVFYLKRRVTPRVCYTQTFKPRTAADAEDIPNCILLLFQPWRDETQLRGSHKTFAAALEAAQPSLPDCYQKWQAQMDRRADLTAQLRKLHDEVVEEQLAEEENGAPDTNPSGEEAAPVGACHIPQGPALDALVTSLNKGQRAVFEHVVNSLRHQRLHREHLRQGGKSEERCSWLGCSGQPEQVKEAVLGGAGVGKSRLISAITGQVNTDARRPSAVLTAPVDTEEEATLLVVYAPETDEADALPLPDVVQLCAPTGVASWLIGGSTLHSTFSIPIAAPGERAVATELLGDKLKDKRAQFNTTVLLVIDELSMVSNKTLLFISKRLEQIRARADTWFGGLNVLLLGDLAQLQPVRADPIYKVVKGDLFGTRLRMGVDVWAQLRISFLTENMRAAGDATLGQLLADVSVGNATDAVIDVLHSRRIFGYLDDPTKAPDPKHPNFAKQFLPLEIPVWRPEDYMSEEELNEGTVAWLLAWESANPQRQMTILVPTVEQCQTLSTIATRMRNIPNLTKIPCQDELVTPWNSKKRKGGSGGRPAAGRKVAETGGLEEELVLGIGSRVMLRRNIDAIQGLVNGACGIVTQLSYGPRKGSGIDVITVRLNADNTSHDIRRVAASFKLRRNSSDFVLRHQFPLINADAITVHKAQVNYTQHLTTNSSSKKRKCIEGLTLEAAALDLGWKAAMPNLAYVALSRVRDLRSIFIIRLNPGSILTDEKGVEVRSSALERAGLPPLPPPNQMSSAFPGIRTLIAASRKPLPTALPKQLYANTPAGQPDATHPRNSSQSQGKGRESSVTRTPKPAPKAKLPQSSPSQGTPKALQAKNSAESSTPTIAASTWPARLAGDAEKLINAFSWPYQVQHGTPEQQQLKIAQLRTAITSADNLSSLTRMTAWLRSLEPRTLLTYPASLNEDDLNPQQNLYQCLHPLITIVTTEANGDCLVNALLGDVAGGSSLRLARLLRAVVSATFVLHWDFFVKIEALRNFADPQEPTFLSTLHRDLCDAATSKNYMVDVFCCAASYVLGREIHVYNACYERKLVDGHVVFDVDGHVVYDFTKPIAGPQVETSLDSLKAAVAQGTIYHLIGHGSQPFFPASTPALIMFNGVNHYSTLLPASSDMAALLPTPVYFLPPDTAEQQAQLRLEADLPLLPLVAPQPPPPPPQPPQHPKPAPGRKGRAQPPYGIHPTANKNLPPNIRKPTLLPLNAIPDWNTWAKSKNLSNTPNPPVPFNASINGQLRIHQGDILKIQVDCITNAANCGLEGGGGIDGTIHAAAGTRMAAYNKKMYPDGCPVGSARSSPGFNLIANHVIHAVGPDYRILDGTSAGRAEAAALLDSAYASVLAEAACLGATSVALPCISVGIYKFPGAQAAAIAAAAVRRFLHSQRQNPKMTVVLVLWSQENELDYALALPTYFPTK